MCQQEEQLKQLGLNLYNRNVKEIVPFGFHLGLAVGTETKGQQTGDHAFYGNILASFSLVNNTTDYLLLEVLSKQVFKQRVDYNTGYSGPKDLPLIINDITFDFAKIINTTQVNVSMIFTGYKLIFA